MYEIESNYSADQMGAATPRYLRCNKQNTELILQRLSVKESFVTQT